MNTIKDLPKSSRTAQHKHLNLVRSTTPGSGSKSVAGENSGNGIYGVRSRQCPRETLIGTVDPMTDGTLTYSWNQPTSQVLVERRARASRILGNTSLSVLFFEFFTSGDSQSFKDGIRHGAHKAKSFRLDIKGVQLDGFNARIAPCRNLITATNEVGALYVAIEKTSTATLEHAKRHQQLHNEVNAALTVDQLRSKTFRNSLRNINSLHHAGEPKHDSHFLQHC